jgi:FtsP/CotA-like multicopper oxidase with cupredoxin domain
MKNIKLNILYSVVAIGLAALNVNANELSEPSVFVSNKNSKVLDLLMIAKPAPIDALPSVTGWVYEICERKYSMDNTCLSGKSNLNRNPYGGARLQLNPGDTLKVHLVNKLPPIPESSHKDEPGEAFLGQNPTNLHTHGLLVSPSKPTDKNNPIYGDNIFVLTFNSANGKPDTASSFHLHGDVQPDATDYRIVIPKNHPSGLFWFHPHAHGISLNQISAGLSGIITIGDVTDYMPRLPAGIKTRHLILKDTQVNADSTLNSQQDPGFCDGSTISEPGLCGVNGLGKWYFTVNGQLNPTINVKSDGEVWRITNSSGSVTYDLQLAKQFKDHDAPIALQLLSVDGVSVTPVDSTKSELKEIGGAKFELVPCPGAGINSPKAVCISKLTMMPSSRAEILVVNRDVDGKVIDADNSSAIFKTIGYKTGVDADNWPAVDLAQVQFSGTEHINHEPVVEVSDTRHNGDGLKLNAIANDLAAANAAVGSDSNPNCAPLPAGWKRRIYYGVPTDAEFGLGFELVDEKGQTVPNSFQDVSAFNMHSKSICLPLATGNNPVFERWELINLATEDHNFHIHQTKFRVVADSEKKRTRKANFARGILQDNLPLLSGGDGCDGTVAAWKSGACKTSPSVVEIPFAVAGDFVYHCHILEHEDGGMMAAIHVVGANK